MGSGAHSPHWTDEVVWPEAVEAVAGVALDLEYSAWANLKANNGDQKSPVAEDGAGSGDESGDRSGGQTGAERRGNLYGGADLWVDVLDDICHSKNTLEEHSEEICGCEESNLMNGPQKRLMGTANENLEWSRLGEAATGAGQHQTAYVCRTCYWNRKKKKKGQSSNYRTNSKRTDGEADMTVCCCSLSGLVDDGAWRTSVVKGFW